MKFASFAAIIVAAALAVGPSAAAASELEGVWSFSGGAVAVQKLPNGSLRGTVVEPTTFAVCRHPVGQVMWTAIKAKPDGSYWGLHQWFHGSDCQPDGPQGLTAWRVLTDSLGRRRIEVCFSDPGSDSQPRIAPDGSSAGVTYGCTESEPLGPVPGSAASTGTLDAGSFVDLPPDRSCSGAHRLRILLHRVRYDPLAELSVWVNGKRVATLGPHAAAKKSFVLQNVPEEAFRLRITAITVLGQHFLQRRVYPACRGGSGKIRVHKGHHHHVRGRSRS